MSLNKIIVSLLSANEPLNTIVMHNSNNKITVKQIHAKEKARASISELVLAPVCRLCSQNIKI